MTSTPYEPLTNLKLCIADVSDSMQNLILQHSSIDTSLTHYLDRNINVDVQNIYRGQASQRDLMRFACSMSRSIDPRRPRKLTTAQSKSVNCLLYILKLDRRVAKSSIVQRCPGGRIMEKKTSIKKLFVATLYVTRDYIPQKNRNTLSTPAKTTLAHFFWPNPGLCFRM